MPEQPDQSSDALRRTQRKRLLVLACAADRLAWMRACRPTPGRHQVARLSADLLGCLAPFFHLLPGRSGYWLRGADFLLQVARQFGWVRH